MRAHLPSPEPLVLRVGDRVVYRPYWGKDVPRVAVVTSMTVTAEPREKYGEEVQEVPWDVVRANRCIVSLGSSWAYGSQIDGVA